MDDLEQGPNQTGGRDLTGGARAIQGDPAHGDRVGGDSIQAGDIEGVGIAIGAGASVRIYGDVHYYPIKLRAPLRKVFDPLIADRMALFSGREAALEQIGCFIQDPAGGYLMVTAPAGFGKTALMAALVSRTPEAFAYHFFTPLYGESSLSEIEFLKNVVEQMAEWHGHTELLPGGLQELRALYWRFIAEPLEQTQVLVLDGLDEVRTWKVAPYLMRHLPDKLHILLTVRDVGQDWRSDYQLPAGQTQALPLGGLEQADIRQLLQAAGKKAITEAGEAKDSPEETQRKRNAGEQAIRLANDAGFIQAVLEAALYTEDERLGADPFYVRFLAEDVAAGAITKENIHQQPKGLDKYLDQWWQEVKAMAGEAPAKDLFGTLAAALGPLSRSDLEAINPSLRDDWAADFFTEILNKVRRYVMGDEARGYALAHPRLRQYLRAKIRTGPYQQKLLAYCAGWVEHQSDYALAHYAEHLVEAGDPAGLYALISKPWMALKYQKYQSHRSFAQDIHLAARTASSADPPDIPQAVRDALLYATLGELVAQAPPWALEILALGGQMERAGEYARLTQDPARRSEVYLRLAKTHLKQNEHEQTTAALDEALKAARRIDDLGVKAFSLGRIARLLAEAGRKNEAALVAHEVPISINQVDPRQQSYLLEILAEAAAQAGSKEEAVAAAKRVMPWQKGQYVLHRVARELAQAGWVAEAFSIASENVYSSEAFAGVAEVLAKSGLAKEALTAARQIDDLGVKTKAFSQVAQALAETGRQEEAVSLAHEALAEVERIDEPGQQAFSLSGVAGALAAAGQTEEAVSVVHKALAVVELVEYEGTKAEVYSRLAGALATAGQEEKAISVARKALDAAELIQMEMHKNPAFRGIATVLAGQGLFDQALTAVERIKYDSLREESLGIVASSLMAAGRKEAAVSLAGKAILDKEYINYTGVEAEALSSIATALAAVGRREEAVSVVHRAIAAADRAGARRGGDQWEKHNALDHVAATLAKAGMADLALAAARHIDHEARKKSSIGRIAQGLATTGLFDQAMTAVESLSGEWDKDSALENVGLALATQGKVDLALTAAEKMTDRWRKADALNGVVKILVNRSALDQALRVAERIGEGQHKAEAYRCVLERLAAGRGEAALPIARKALAAIKRIDHPGTKAKALSSLVETLREKLLERALAAGLFDQAQAVAGAFADDNPYRSDALKSLARAWAAAGQLDKALNNVAALQWDFLIADALEDIAIALVRLGRFDEAMAILNRAEIGWKRENVLVLLAESLTMAGEADQGLKLVELIGDDGRKSNALEGVALALARSGRVDQSFAAAEQVTVGRMRDQAFARLAEVLAKQGQVAESWAAAEHIPAREERLIALASAAEALAGAGLFDRALETIERIDDRAAKDHAVRRAVKAHRTVAPGQALKAVELIEDQAIKDDTLRSIAEALGPAGRVAEALAAAEQIHSEEIKADALAWVAAGLAERGEEALPIFLRAVLEAQTIGRQSILKLVTGSAPAVAGIDHGDTLWNEYNAIEAVEAWWDR